MLNDTAALAYLVAGCGESQTSAKGNFGSISMSGTTAICGNDQDSSEALDQDQYRNTQTNTPQHQAKGKQTVADVESITTGRAVGTIEWDGRGNDPCAGIPGGIAMQSLSAQFIEGIGYADSLQRFGGFCIPPTAPATPGQPAAPAPPPPVIITTEEFKTLPLKERTTMCSCTPDENNKPSGVVTVPIAFWQDTETETITTTLLGQIVQVQATPTQWAYNFGNGQTLTTTNPGIPYHENPKTTPPSTIPNTIWTSYEHRGNYPIRQTITYNAQYSVNGGPWQPIQGTAQRPGPSLDIPIKSFIALEVAPNY